MFYEKKDRKCPVCDGKNIQKWGNRNGKQRFHCRDCFHNFSISNEGVKLSNQFVWFEKWIMERQVYKYLVRDSGISQSSIQRIFKQYLNSAPDFFIRSKSNVHLLIDGTYFNNGLCLILYYDYDIQYVQLYRETNKEKYKEIKEDLENLRKLGVDVYSVTCDGHLAILKAVMKVYPQAVIQRCVVHVKRQIRNYLSTNPRLEQSKQLLSISNKVTRIETMEASAYWLVEFYRWYEGNKTFINEKVLNPDTEMGWYKHKKLHLATSHIINAIPYLFCYLNDPAIPKTSNKIEGYFSHLKEKLTIHRGLRFEAKKNFIKWYLYLKNNGCG